MEEYDVEIMDGLPYSCGAKNEDQTGSDKAKSVVPNGFVCVPANNCYPGDRVKGVNPILAARNMGQFVVMDGKKNKYKFDKSDNRVVEVTDDSASVRTFGTIPMNEDIRSKMYETDFYELVKYLRFKAPQCRSNDDCPNYTKVVNNKRYEEKMICSVFVGVRLDTHSVYECDGETGERELKRQELMDYTLNEDGLTSNIPPSERRCFSEVLATGIAWKIHQG